VVPAERLKPISAPQSVGVEPDELDETISVIASAAKQSSFCAVWIASLRSQ
jgi:hypothetical protein